MDLSVSKEEDFIYEAFINEDHFKILYSIYRGIIASELLRGCQIIMVIFPSAPSIVSLLSTLQQYILVKDIIKVELREITPVKIYGVNLEQTSGTFREKLQMLPVLEKGSFAMFVGYLNSSGGKILKHHVFNTMM